MQFIVFLVNHLLFFFICVGVGMGEHVYIKMTHSMH